MWRDKSSNSRSARRSIARTGRRPKVLEKVCVITTGTKLSDAIEQGKILGELIARAVGREDGVLLQLDDIHAGAKPVQ